MSTTTESKLTMEALRAFVQDPKAQAARALVLKTTAYAKAIRMQVDTYIAPVFARFSFTADKDTRGSEQGRKITSPRDIYLSNDEEQVTRFFAACDEAHKAKGYEIPAGYCPALIAEHEQIKAQNALIALASEAFGFDFSCAYGEDRAKLLALLRATPKN